MTNVEKALYVLQELDLLLMEKNIQKQQTDSPEVKEFLTNKIDAIDWARNMMIKEIARKEE